MHTFRYPSSSRGLCRWRLHNGRLQAQGANGEEGERQEATLPAEEAAQVKEAAVSAQSSVASRHVESVQPIMYYAQNLSEGFYDDMQAIEP